VQRCGERGVRHRVAAAAMGLVVCLKLVPYSSSSHMAAPLSLRIESAGQFDLCAAQLLEHRFELLGHLQPAPLIRVELGVDRRQGGRGGRRAPTIPAVGTGAEDASHSSTPGWCPADAIV
jgi:hypothetical protein